jgi:hypothetical protein
VHAQAWTLWLSITRVSQVSWGEDREVLGCLRDDGRGSKCSHQAANLDMQGTKSGLASCATWTADQLRPLRCQDNVKGWIG